jgi:23S rRNA G2445 N2-methylase RlmL
MAQAYPESTFVGYDAHGKSIQIACRRAQEADIKDRVKFEVATAKDFLRAAMT